MRVIVKEPSKAPEIKEIDNDLKVLQTIIGGHIETVTFGKELIVICNEDGKLMGLPANIRVWNDIIAGTVIILRRDEENFASLTDELIDTIIFLLNPEDGI